MQDELAKRVVKMEVDAYLKEHRDAMESLTTAINNLVIVMEQGKNAFKVLCFMIAMVGAVSSALTWLASHITFRG